jgi:hypothetical protein
MDKLEFIKSLVQKAADSHDAESALHFSQAAFNVAQAFATLHYMEQPIEPKEASLASG